MAEMSSDQAYLNQIDFGSGQLGWKRLKGALEKARFTSLAT
jgi:hypothetical protein